MNWCYTSFPIRIPHVRDILHICTSFLVIGHYVISHCVICTSKQPVNRSQWYPQLIADRPLTEAVGGELGYFIRNLLAVRGGAGEQVMVFGTVALELEVQKGAGLLDAAQAYVFGTVKMSGKEADCIANIIPLSFFLHLPHKLHDVPYRAGNPG
jgi:hypothetical protein